MLRCIWLGLCVIHSKLVAVLFRNKCNKNREKCNNNTSLSSSWNDIPKELLELILIRVTVRSRVRMSCACQSWRRVAMQKDLHYPPPLPWLLLPQSEKASSEPKVSFYDMSEGSVLDFRVPEDRVEGDEGGMCTCWGAYRGWLAMATRSCSLFNRKRQQQLFLWNPLTGTQLQLPPPQTIPPMARTWRFWPSSVFPNERKWVEPKIALSSEDPSQCIIAAIIDNSDLLALCQPGDEEWSIFEGFTGDCIYDDILFSKDGTTLYVLTLDEDNDTGPKYETRFFRLNSGREIKLVLIHAGLHGAYFEHGTDTADMSLVESADGGQLLIVARVYDGHSTGYFQTLKFEVHELLLQGDDNEDEENNNGFRRIARLENNNLNALKDRVLFLGFSETFFFQESSDESESYSSSIGEDSCIYFAVRQDSRRQSPEIGVFHCDDGRMTRYLRREKLPTSYSLMCWFRPSSTVVVQ